MGLLGPCERPLQVGGGHRRGNLNTRTIELSTVDEGDGRVGHQLDGDGGQQETPLVVKR